MKFAFEVCHDETALQAEIAGHIAKALASYGKRANMTVFNGFSVAENQAGRSV